jgi:hypothetical protein
VRLAFRELSLTKILTTINCRLGCTQTSGAPFSTSSLSFPSLNEFANSLVMVHAYNVVHEVAEVIVNFPFATPDLIQQCAECDHRQAIHMNVLLRADDVYHESYFGCLGRSRVAYGTILFDIHTKFDIFDYEGFKQVSATSSWYHLFSIHYFP